MAKVKQSADAEKRDPMKDAPVETLRDVATEVTADEQNPAQDPSNGVQTAKERKTEVKITLLFPEKNPLTNELQETLTIRRLKTKDLRQIAQTINPDDDAMLTGVKIIAGLCEEEVDADFIDNLDAEDFSQLQKAMDEVFPEGLPTLAR